MKERKDLAVIECSGTLYEIGKQYGRACKESILKSIEMNLGTLKQTYHASKEQVFVNTKKFVPHVERFDPEAIEMLRGQAEGAGVGFDEVFTLRCMINLVNYYNQIMALCTSFAAAGEATKDGKTLIGQNIDWTPDSPMNLLKKKHANGLEQLTLDFGGCNEWSLSSAGYGEAKNMILSPPEVQSRHVPTSFVSFKALRQKNIGDALGVFCEAARGVEYHVLASGEGDVIGIESTPDDFSVLQPQDDILVHSNHYLTERFEKGDWVYGLLPDTYLRVHRLRRLMDLHRGSLSVGVMMELMADHNNYPNSICRHIDEDKPQASHLETVASVIMVPEDRIIYLSYGQPCRYEYVEYRL